jgi:hypothetical protein
MNIVKFYLITLLTWSLVYTSDIFAQVPTGETQVVSVMKMFNDKASTVKDAISFIGSTDSSKGAELLTMIKKENLSLDAKIPKLLLKNKILQLKIQNELFSLTLLDEGKIIVSNKDKKVELDKKMSLEQMKLAMETSFVSQNTFSFPELLISSSHAIIPIGLAILILVVSISALLMASMVYDGIHDTMVKNKGEELNNSCLNWPMSKNLTSGDEAQIRKILASITDAYSKANCQRYEGSYRGYESDYRPTLSAACNNFLSATKCFNELLAKSPSVNQTQKNTGKKIETTKEKSPALKTNTSGK